MAQWMTIRRSGRSGLTDGAAAAQTNPTAADGRPEMRPVLALLLILSSPALAQSPLAPVTGNQKDPSTRASTGGVGFAPNLSPSSAAPSVSARAAPLAPLVRPDAGLPQRLVAAPGEKDFDDEPAQPFTPQADLDWATYLPGRWRMSGGRDCNRGGYGLLELGNGLLRFEWRLPGGGVNVAVERIDREAGSTVQTTVVSDSGTANPEVGHRVRYQFGPNAWTSVNLTTGERGRHTRC